MAWSRRRERDWRLRWTAEHRAAFTQEFGPDTVDRCVLVRFHRADNGYRRASRLDEAIDPVFWFENRLLEEESALEVRRAMTSNRAGKASIALQWVTALALVAMGFARAGNPLVAAIAGYVSFMFVREITTFGVVETITRGPRDSQRA